jgi:uncharacterized phage protein gp47/JayE
VAIEFLTPNQIGDDYLLHLKTLKPEVNIDQTDSDWWIRSRVVGGVLSGVYQDQRKIADDVFPQSARSDALEKHLITLFGSGFIQATAAHGYASVTGTPSTTVPLSTQFIYTPNGNVYQSTQAVTLTGATGLIPVQSVNTGQAQNLLEGASLTLPTPPGGINALAEVFSGPLTDGRDQETNDQASQRILDRLRSPPAGGTAADYKAFAKAADPSVNEVNVIRWIYGLGTVGVVITAGTTDIDTAVTNGDPVVRLPSQALIDIVDAYIQGVKPLTDCSHVLGPAVVTLDVTVKVAYAQGNGSTILPGQTLTQEQLVQREVSRAIYKTPPGGRRFGASGYVLASDIEESLDVGLSAQSTYQTGNFGSVLTDRQCVDLAASGPNRLVLDREIVDPGVITVISF